MSEHHVDPIKKLLLQKEISVKKIYDELNSTKSF